MTRLRYVTVRLTAAQAFAAANACDLIRDNYESDNNKREAAVYERAAATIQTAIDEARKS